MQTRQRYYLIGIVGFVVFLFWGLVLYLSNSDAITLDQSDPFVKSETCALAGHWQITNVTDDGRNVFRSYFPVDHYFLMSGSNLIWYDPFASSSRGECSTVQVLRLDPYSTPKILDVIDYHTLNVQKGIYTVDGDKLQIILSGTNELRRPTQPDQQSGIVFTLKRVKMEPVEYYEQKLLDKDYEWYGPSPEVKISRPALHAARALAFYGDAAVPALLRAIENEGIPLQSITLALFQIGLPVYDKEYKSDISHRNSNSLKIWWAENRNNTAIQRSQFRVSIGLPPVEGVEIQKELYRNKYDLRVIDKGGIGGGGNRGTRTDYDTIGKIFRSTTARSMRIRLMSSTTTPTGHRAA